MKDQIITQVIAGLITVALIYLWTQLYKRLRRDWNKVKSILSVVFIVLISFVGPIFNLIIMYINDPFDKGYLLNFTFNILIILGSAILLIVGKLFSDLSK